MGKSIFDLTDKTGYESPWEENWAETENINSSRLGTNQSSNSNGKVHLETENTTFAIKTDFILRFKFYGYENFLYREDYKITLTCSDSAVKTSPKSLTTENGEVFLFEISRDKPAKAQLKLAINGVQRYTYDIEFIESKDVFTSTQVDRLKDEYKYVAQFNNMEDPPDEYVGNYCMQGADRAIGKLLNNSTDFYTVEHGTHKVKNSINFSAGTGNTYQRAKTMNSKGFINSSYTIDSKYWNVDHTERKTINSKYPPYENARNYARSVMFKLAWVSESHGKNFFFWLKKKCDNSEPGYHIYYLSIVDGFHTQVLVIDNSVRSNPRYEIWDDHGITTSSGKLDKISDGINRQTSSMFTSSCLIRLKNGTSDKWDSQTLKVWKIKKK